MNREIKIIGMSFILIITTLIITGCGSSTSSYNPSNVIRKGISSDKNFTYETSITDSISKEKADVYKTDLSVKNATKQVSSMGIATDNKTLLDGRANILKFGNEEVFIYEGEDSKTTYVQISNEAYLSNKGYSHTHRGGKFLKTYGILSLCDDFSKARRSYSPSKRKSGGSSGSVRSSSSGSRTSSGGGTSFGK